MATCSIAAVKGGGRSCKIILNVYGNVRWLAEQEFKRRCYADCKVQELCPSVLVVAVWLRKWRRNMTFYTSEERAFFDDVTVFFF